MAISVPIVGLPPFGRLAGVDYGTVRVGLAICDPTQTWVTPFCTYHRVSREKDALFFSRFAESEQIVGWVVGLPIHCDGQDSQKSKEASLFADWLLACTERPYVMFDERFSSANAEQLLRDAGLNMQRRKERIDQIAAHLILSHFLESGDQMSSPRQALDDAPP